MSGRKLSRRTMLRGALAGGATVALALPTLEAMLGSGKAEAAPLPPVFGIFYWANGMPWHDAHGPEQAGHPDLWTPPTIGKDYTPSELIAPIAAFKPSVVTGLTPHRYVLRARLRRAAVRLATNDARVVDVAIACGFRDVSNFNHAFRAEFGVTPRAHRRSAERRIVTRDT